MPRSVTFDPVVTRTGTTKVVVPQVARTTSSALDPKCRLITGDQFVLVEPAQ